MESSYGIASPAPRNTTAAAADSFSAAAVAFSAIQAKCWHCRQDNVTFGR